MIIFYSCPITVQTKTTYRLNVLFMSVLVWVIWDDAKLDTVIAPFSVCPIKIDHERTTFNNDPNKKGK